MDTRNITFKGQPLHLAGNPVKIGQQAPDFEVVDGNMNVVNFSNFRGKVCLISSVPSLDTPVCDMQTHRFNQEAGSLGHDVVVLTISMDLPFAQKRWCGAGDVHNIVTLSDYRFASFGEAFGILIKEWRLLGRGVFLIDREGIVRYSQYVKEISEHPDYQSAIEETRRLIQSVRA